MSETMRRRRHSLAAAHRLLRYRCRQLVRALTGSAESVGTRPTTVRPSSPCDAAAISAARLAPRGATPNTAATAATH